MYLIEWFFDAIQTLYESLKDNFSSGGPNRQMARQLRLMFGRGEIDAKTFFNLRTSLEKGYYIAGELQMYHRQGMARLQAEGKYPDHFFNPEVKRSLDQLYLRRAMLAEARLEMNQALRIIDSQRKWVRQQADTIRAEAMQSLPDKSSARTFLEIREDLLDQSSILEQRASQVRQQLRKLESLAARLGVYESELLLVDSKEHYVNIDLALRQ